MNDKNINFSEFIDDIELMAALFYNNKLNKNDIKKIADNITSFESDDNLIAILLSDDTEEINYYFKKYIENKHIIINDKKRFLIRKIFQYILNGRIDLINGIKFIDFEIRDFKDDKEIVGDSVGIEKVLGNFYLINDGDVTTEKDIESTKKIIQEEIKEYIKNN